MIPRAAGILLAGIADVVFGDPKHGHPVAGFGRCASALESLTYRDDRAAGAVHAVALVGAVTAVGVVAQRVARGPMATAALTAVATWTALGGTTLVRTGAVMADELERGDVDGARRILPALCGRDPASLDEPGLARAALESVAENSSDAHVAPLLWAALGGAPAVLAYRAINTLDAMVGNRSPRYARFGWAAARLDDLANLVPARVTALLTALCAPVEDGSALGALRAWRTDAARHPSPNAGVAEAAFAGALGVRLGGPTQYRYELEIRPTLGDGPPPQITDLRRGLQLSRWVQGAAVVLAAAAVAVGEFVLDSQRSR